jgi:glycosyltransferase involved in cell wall biosynthesis
LLIAGDGPLRAEMQCRVAALHVPDVRFAGFLNQSELPSAYAVADAFVLPSKIHETWGLVVNEAMNFGLPVVVSDKAGCAADLVRSGANGLVVPHGDTAALAGAIARLVDEPDTRARFGVVSRRIIDRYSIESCADGIVAACTATRGVPAEREPALAA